MFLERAAIGELRQLVDECEPSERGSIEGAFFA
jgi:hypothetical protein